MIFKPIEWKDNRLLILDQRLLPSKEKYTALETLSDVETAIKTLAVRGAPLIGVSAAYGVVVAAIEKTDYNYVERAINVLRKTRPTAVNLFMALDRMVTVLDSAFDGNDPVNTLLGEAKAIHNEDIIICDALSRNGAELLSDGDTILTHCNAGALATSGVGTALGVVYAAKAQGKKIKVYADETRPLLQGARLSAWELSKNGIEVTVICDNMSSVVMKKGLIDHIITGADRIVSNGDSANKIGTYGLAVSAKHHDVPFYIAAPLTTFDFSRETGGEIPIEERDGDEIKYVSEYQVAPDGVSFYNPSFDVTPAELISAIITENGIARMPFRESLENWKKRK